MYDTFLGDKRLKYIMLAETGVSMGTLSRRDGCRVSCLLIEIASKYRIKGYWDCEDFVW